MIDAAHDPFVSRDDSPMGAARRSLFELLEKLEELARDGARTITVSVNDVPLGTVHVGEDAQFSLADGPRLAADTLHLPEALAAWSRHGRALEFRASSPAATDAATSSRAAATAAELFAHAGALSEPAREADAARNIYEAEGLGAGAAVLLRLRERSELLPYPVAARGLGAMDLRSLVELSHAAAALVRPPGWQNPSRASASWGVVEAHARRFAVIPGDTHIAILEADKALQDRLLGATLTSPSRDSRDSHHDA